MSEKFGQLFFHIPVDSSKTQQIALLVVAVAVAVAVAVKVRVNAKM